MIKKIILICIVLVSVMGIGCVDQDKLLKSIELDDKLEIDMQEETYTYKDRTGNIRIKDGSINIMDLSDEIEMSRNNTVIGNNHYLKLEDLEESGFIVYKDIDTGIVEIKKSKIQETKKFSDVKYRVINEEYKEYKGIGRRHKVRFSNSNTHITIETDRKVDLEVIYVKQDYYTVVVVKETYNDNNPKNSIEIEVERYITGKLKVYNEYETEYTWYREGY